nr:acetyltransferase [uncultured Brevibacillus sp.]
MTNKPVILIGNGGHASVLTDILLQQNRPIIGFTAPEYQTNFFDLPYLGTDEAIASFHHADVELVLGIGSVNVSSVRSNIFCHFKEKGYTFSSVIHKSAIISPYSILGEGVQIMAGTVTEAFAEIADNTIINTSSSINHDCRIGKHCHIAPGTTLSGNVTVGDFTHIGAGATVIQNVQIGRNVLIGAGSLVLHTIGDGRKAIGVPAKEV